MSDPIDRDSLRERFLERVQHVAERYFPDRIQAARAPLTPQQRRRYTLFALVGAWLVVIAILSALELTGMSASQ